MTNSGLCLPPAQCPTGSVRHPRVPGPPCAHVPARLFRHGQPLFPRQLCTPRNHMGPWAEPAPRLASTLGVRVGDGRPSPLKSTPPGAEPEPLFPITVPRVPVGPSGSLLSPGCSPEELRLFIQKISPFAQALSRVQFFVIPWTVARQAPLSMGFSRQEYWSGLPFSPPGDLPDLGVEPTSPWWLSWKRIHPQCKRPGFDPWVGNIR